MRNVLVPIAAAAILSTTGCALLGQSADDTVATKITPGEITAAQQEWGAGIVAIGTAYTAGEDYRAVASELIDRLYAFDAGGVLFKPTKASDQPFRLDTDSALSYFVTGSIAEDGGFAITPWTDVRFENADILIDSDSALAMGHYFFTDTGGTETKVEYTFGYVRGNDGRLLINLQHSSLPFSGG